MRLSCVFPNKLADLLLVCNFVYHSYRSTARLED